MHALQAVQGVPSEKLQAPLPLHSLLLGHKVSSCVPHQLPLRCAAPTGPEEPIRRGLDPPKPYPRQFSLARLTLLGVCYSDRKLSPLPNPLSPCCHPWL